MSVLVLTLTLVLALVLVLVLRMAAKAVERLRGWSLLLLAREPMLCREEL